MTHDRPRAFIPGETTVPASGKVIGAPELQRMVEASLDGWLTTGRFNEAFEKRLAQFLGRNYCITTNSGSSANLLAFSALTSPQLGERALQPGDEVISVAAGFPTTVNPILMWGMVPVFVDVDIPTYNIRPDLIEAAITDKTRAIMLAHTLGNPYDLDEITRLARKYNLWLVEDCCDALGSTYAPAADGKPRLVGTFGDIGTVSFYPAHHITMGEGGAVFTNNPDLKRIAESFRDWGRDCYCAPGKENTCGKRFGWQLGSLPKGYDHKYTYSHLGYNLKITDMQAACALAQMDRLDGFIAARKHNFAWLTKRLASVEEFLDPAEGHARIRPVVVRVPDHAARGGADRPRRASQVPRPVQDRHPPSLRRQPHPPAVDDRAALPRAREAHQHRPDHERHVLDRRVSRADRGDAGVRGGQDRGVFRCEFLMTI